MAIKGVMKSAISKINKAVRKGYNMNAKYLKRFAKVSPMAKQNSLYAGITLRSAPIPMIGFKPKQKGSNISVTIKKGKKEVFRKAFIATMNTGHTGVYARGHYEKRKFKPGKKFTKNGKVLITELNSASSFTMGTSQKVASEVRSFMGTEVLKRVEGILKSKVDKIAGK
jgi:hypothetical protein